MEQKIFYFRDRSLICLKFSSFLTGNHDERQGKTTQLRSQQELSRHSNAFKGKECRLFSSVFHQKRKRFSDAHSKKKNGEDSRDFALKKKGALLELEKLINGNCLITRLLREIKKPLEGVPTEF